MKLLKYTVAGHSYTSYKAWTTVKVFCAVIQEYHYRCAMFSFVEFLAAMSEWMSKK